MPLYQVDGIWYWSPDNNPLSVTNPAALYSSTGSPINGLPGSPSSNSPPTGDVVLPRSITFTLAGRPGVTVNVVEDGGNLDFHLKTTGKADLSGLFFDLTNSKLSTLKIAGGTQISQFLAKAGGVGNLANGVNLNGQRVSNFDVGMEFGTAGIGADHGNIQSENFVLSDSAHDLSINDLHPAGETGTVGVRDLSAGQKLEAVAPYAPTATPDQVTTTEDTPYTIPVSDLATDLNSGAKLTISAIGTGAQGPQYGTVTIAPDGQSLIYTPTILDNKVDGILTGNRDAFQVGVTDSLGGQVTSFVTVNATPVADTPKVTVTVLSPQANDPINKVRLAVTAQSGDYGTADQGSDFIQSLGLNLTGDVTAGTAITDSKGLLSGNTIDASSKNTAPGLFTDEIDLLMPANTTLNDQLAVTATAAEGESPTTTASGTHDQTIGIKYQSNDETPKFQTLANDSIWNTGSSFSTSKDLFLGADIPLDTSIGDSVANFSSSGEFKAGLTDTFNVHGGTITAHLPFDVKVDTTYNTTTDTLLIHTGDTLQSGASFTTTGPGGSFTLGAIFKLNDTLALGGSLIDTLGLGFSYPFNVESSAASLIPGDTTGGGSITDSDTTTTKIPVGPDPLAPLGYISVAWPQLSTSSTTQSGDTITGDAASNNFIQFDLDLLRWAAAVDPVVFGPIQGVLGPPLNDPNGFAPLQAFANVGANLQQNFALQAAPQLDGTLSFADGSTQSFVVGQDVTIPNASKLAGSDGDIHLGLSLTPQATLENTTSVGVNVGADLYLLNNLPSIVNDILGTPIHLTGSTGVFSIPIADSGPFPLAFGSQNYNFVT
jgi:hypothetical protein